MNVFISGGCKNGKSMFAQQIAKAMAKPINGEVAKGKKLYYLATMIPADQEDRKRISNHLKDREGWGFETVEQGKNICQALERADRDGVFLLDSVTALLSNEMFDHDGHCNINAGEQVAKQLLEFADKTGNTVFVSDYIYSDARHFDHYTEKYRQSLALIDRSLAEVCDQVIEVAFGNKFYYK